MSTLPFSNFSHHNLILPYSYHAHAPHDFEIIQLLLDVWSTYFRYVLNELEKDIARQSNTLIDAPNQKVIHEHAISFKIVRGKLMNLKELREESVSSLLEQYHVIAKISNEEHQELKDAGLDSKMPDSWDGKNKFARYESVGIEIVCSKSK